MGNNESMNQALIDCVKAAGGSKIVGSKLWPEKTIEAAQRHLLACLNEDKPERLTPDHLLMLLKLSRDHGHHDGIGYVLESLGYAPTTPIEPKDEAAELMRQVIESQKVLAIQVARLAVLQPQLRAVA